MLYPEPLNPKMKGIVTAPTQSLHVFSHDICRAPPPPPPPLGRSRCRTHQHSKHNQRLNHFVCPSTPSPSNASSSVVEDPDTISFSGCKGCGREQVESGCNGEGRIQGGIATIPGFGWWPIKAYRPCPGFLASGGNYRRRGQSMDEVAFGGGKRGKSRDD